MGTPGPISNVLLILAAFSRHESAFDWTQDWAESQWGATLLKSPRFCFTETGYYDASMGGPLWKMFFAMKRLIDPASLPDIKLATNGAERTYAAAVEVPERRPLNLDPGYLTESKLILASTKDHAHRIYVGKGIFAEITLRYRRGGWSPWEWTYPDYRRADYHAFFDQARDAYRHQRLVAEAARNPGGTL